MSSALLLPATLLLQKDSNASLRALWNRELQWEGERGAREVNVFHWERYACALQHACPSADDAKTVCVVISDTISNEQAIQVGVQHEEADVHHSVPGAREGDTLIRAACIPMLSTAHAFVSHLPPYTKQVQLQHGSNKPFLQKSQRVLCTQPDLCAFPLLPLNTAHL